MPRTGWELIERRGDGKWYTVDRSYDPSSRDRFRRWIDTAAYGRRTFELREVQEGDDLMSGSPYPWDYHQEENSMPTRDPHEEGFIFGRAMAKVFVIREAHELSDVFSLAERFAMQSSYLTSGPDYAAYMRGFAEGIEAVGRVVQAQLTVPPPNTINSNT
jgi:hypothetical protein